MGTQYASALSKNANCQALVSLTLAQGEVPVPIALRLFLPEAWTKDPERMRRAGVPDAFHSERSKPEIALVELKRALEAGVRFRAVVADAGYGISAAFRQALSALGLLWAVGIPRIQKVYPVDVQLVPAPPTRGRPRQTLIPDREAVAAEKMVAAWPWRWITWRQGTKGPLRAQFAAIRVRVADGPEVRLQGRTGQHLPGARYRRMLLTVGVRRQRLELVG